MFVYYDKNGVLKEIVNDRYARQGDGNSIDYVYFFIERAEEEIIDGVHQPLTFSALKRTFLDEEGNVVGVQDESVSMATEDLEIPYNKERQLQYFKYFEKYKMYKIALTNDVLNESGTYGLRIRIVNADTTIMTLGFLAFYVEMTGEKPIISEDTAITIAQWNYLVGNMTMPADLLNYALKNEVVPLKSATSSTTISDLCGTNAYTLCFIKYNNVIYYFEGIYTGGGYVCIVQRLGGVLKRSGSGISGSTTFANILTTLTQNDYIDMATSQNITGIKTLKNRLIVDGFSGNGVISLYESNINTNNKNSFARVWVDSANYVNYNLPYGPSDAGQNLQTHILATKYYVDEQINEVEMQSDVIDIVGTYADLQAYDTQHVKENDLIKVISDSTHNNATSYYRWVSNAWVYVASEGPYYTTSQADNLFVTKTTQIAGVSIGSGISAVDLYSGLFDITEVTIDED